MQETYICVVTRRGLHKLHSNIRMHSPMGSAAYHTPTQIFSRLKLEGTDAGKRAAKRAVKRAAKRAAKRAGKRAAKRAVKRAVKRTGKRAGKRAGKRSQIIYYHPRNDWGR
jgi:sRNA-binding protein